MQHVMANYTLPTVLNTVKPIGSGGLAKPASTKAKTAATSSSTGTATSSSSSGTDLSTTFLSLLAQELQNQDPTAPVDPTQMVGQMISLNQLEQLIGINQTLDTAAANSSSTTPSTKVDGAQTNAAQAISSAQVAAANSGIASMLSPSAAGAATTQLPFDPTTMMPINSANAAAMAASIRNSLNITSTGFSGTNNNTSGGR